VVQRAEKPVRRSPFQIQDLERPIRVRHRRTTDCFGGGRRRLSSLL
jgi:hypothetical protein